MRPPPSNAPADRRPSRPSPSRRPAAGDEVGQRPFDRPARAAPAPRNPRGGAAPATRPARGASSPRPPGGAAGARTDATRGRPTRGGTAKRKPAAKTKRGGRRKESEERLHKYIANCGYCSRRRAELLIERGLVRVNGEVVSEMGVRIDPTRDSVTIHGERVVPPSPTTIVLNKPAGYLTSTEDTHDRLTVMDLLPKKILDAGVIPAGRLDLETEGLLILTNDGDLHHRITHPSFGCVKEYRVQCSRPLTENDIRRLERGVSIRELGKKTAPAKIEHHSKNRDGTATCHVLIGEGMKRQVRRMFEVVGAEVIRLERLAIGGFNLGELPRGKWRTVTPDEIRLLTQKRRDFESKPRG